MHVSLGNMSFSLGPLHTSLVMVWSKLADSRHSLAIRLGLGTSTKLLHHSRLSSMPTGTMICCFVDDVFVDLGGI